MDLNERKRRILKSIVDSYIYSGEPVGSKYLSNALDMSLSSATIRNEMNELERLGLLEQPHTSAGRVPSNLGYRVYVENLMNRYALTLEEIRAVNELLGTKITELNKIMEDVTHLLSAMTDYTAFVLTERSLPQVIKRFDSVYLDDANFLFVMITAANTAKTKQIMSEVKLTVEKLETIVRIFNEYLANIDVSDINEELILKLETLLGDYRGILSSVLAAIFETVREGSGYKVEGMSKLLNYPEFSDISKTKQLISLLEEKESLVNMLTRSLRQDDGLGFMIGDDSADALKPASCVYHTFHINDRIAGVVGLIGPRRMNYSSVIARLEYVAKSLMQYELDSADGEK